MKFNRKNLIKLLKERIDITEYLIENLPSELVSKDEYKGKIRAYNRVLEDIAEMT